MEYILHIPQCVARFPFIPRGRRLHIGSIRARAGCPCLAPAIDGSWRSLGTVRTLCRQWVLDTRLAYGLPLCPGSNGRPRCFFAVLSADRSRLDQQFNLAHTKGEASGSSQRRTAMHSTRLLPALALSALCTGPGFADDLTGTLKKIKEIGAITLGHRESSVPFSYYDDKQEVVGYAMDLCHRIVDGVKK